MPGFEFPLQLCVSPPNSSNPSTIATDTAALPPDSPGCCQIEDHPGPEEHAVALEAEPDRDPGQRRLDDEPAERAGNWRQAHQGVERQWHDRRIGEHLRVVDIHTAHELEYLGPPTDE